MLQHSKCYLKSAKSIVSLDACKKVDLLVVNLREGQLEQSDRLMSNKDCLIRVQWEVGLTHLD